MRGWLTILFCLRLTPLLLSPFGPVCVSARGGTLAADLSRSFGGVFFGRQMDGFQSSSYVGLGAVYGKLNDFLPCKVRCVM
ncbi:hypothetical protein P171DRAFT_248533 [Karstenula rhodostoma CBS 690.94]|uniref:Secreted protein n=1 Tax=Karstenula rhodostoma CBS 690.94 TaxID=1392251 RepID=A0A9P4PN51_9PLEO|nr:hypothetical protein P171DRAFT_248533 [Karstenula rhodostoma CBS 690.94]